MLSVSVLGPVEVRRDGSTISIPGGKTAEVLVRLALEAGTVVRADRLLEDLWADEAINTRRNTLQSKIARLRRALGDPSAVHSRDGGYALDIEPTDVDALAVLDDVATASRLLQAGDLDGAATLSGSALQKFRGQLLPAATGDWAEVHRARLEEARAALLETHFSARLGLGAAVELLGDLEGAVDAHPFQEGLWELLITALYRAGRQADALAAYQRVRGHLTDQLGLEPGPGLRDLERQVLEHDQALRPVAPATPADLTSNLPTMTAELVGRGGELSELADLLGAHRLVTVVGPGGVGKTALAIETGRRLLTTAPLPAGGIWLTRLEGATSASEVADELIAALGVAGGEAALVDRLRSRPSLLVLDNCEHVIEVVAELAVRLLDAAPALRVLCTSQTPLGVDGEVTFELAPLTLVDAVDLFGRRAATHGRRLADDGEDVLRELCRSLDGLPLAIELAAARTKTLSIAEISRRLDDRFNVLSDPTSRRPERRRALRSTIGWSYDLLFPDDQRGLWALATFAGGAPLAAVEHVLGALDVPAAATIDVLGRLASRSLLVTDDEGDPGSIRYRLLESIRAFALDAMADAGMQERAFAAHAAWYADAAGSSTAGVRSAAQAEHLALARVERSNIDAALTWSVTNDPALGLAIALGFGWAWIVLGDSRGSERLLAALGAADRPMSTRDQATALLLAAWIEASTGDLGPARSHITAAEVLVSSAGDHDLEARCSCYLAYVVSHEGQWQQALELTDRAAALYDDLDRPWDQAANALFAARAAISAGDRIRAVETCGAVRRWLQEVEDPWLQVRGEAVLGELARIEHRFDDAVAHLGRAAETSQRLGFRQTEAYQLSSLGRAQCQSGHYTAGSLTLELAISKAEGTGDVRLAALGRVHLGRVLRALGRDAEARSVLEAATAWHRLAGGGEQAALGECLLAAMDAADGDLTAAARLHAVLADARDRDDAPVEVFARDALGRLAAETGDTVTAEDHRAAADLRMEAASHFITDLDRTDAPPIGAISVT